MSHTPLRNRIGEPFIELQTVESSNNYAMAQIHVQLAHHGTVYFAHEQTAGKGQRSKSWTTEKGANIAMSIVIDPRPLLPSQQFQLSATIANAVHEFFSSYAGDETAIKWPNDIYWRDRKAAGILIENVIGKDETTGQGGQWIRAVVGIGININQTKFPDDIPNPVSLKQITGKNYDPVSLGRELCGLLESSLSSLYQQGFEVVLNSYNSNLYQKGNKVRMKKDNRVFEAIIEKVTAQGELIINNGIEEHYGFGDVVWEIPGSKS